MDGLGRLWQGEEIRNSDFCPGPFGSVVSAGPWTKGSPVQFQSRAHSSVVIRSPALAGVV